MARTKKRAPNKRTHKARRWTAKTLPEVAEFFGKSPETMHRLWRPCWGKECQTPGGWDLSAIAQWALSRKAPPDASLADHARKKRELDIAISEQKLAESRRRNLEAECALIDRTIVESELKSAIRALRDMFLEIPSGLITLLGPHGPVVAAEFRRQIERACQEFADRMFSGSGA